jgi:hypothetical protein
LWQRSRDLRWAGNFDFAVGLWEGRTDKDDGGDNDDDRYYQEDAKQNLGDFRNHGQRFLSRVAVQMIGA